MRVGGWNAVPTVKIEKERALSAISDWMSSFDLK
jgi:hypothetical protein